MEVLIMKFMKGVMWGIAMTTGIWMICNETSKDGKNKIMKQGKKIMKNCGMM